MVAHQPEHRILLIIRRFVEKCVITGSSGFRSLDVSSLLIGIFMSQLRQVCRLSGCKCVEESPKFYLEVLEYSMLNVLQDL